MYSFSVLVGRNGSVLNWPLASFSVTNIKTESSAWEKYERLRNGGDVFLFNASCLLLFLPAFFFESPWTLHDPFLSLFSLKRTKKTPRCKVGGNKGQRWSSSSPSKSKCASSPPPGKVKAKKEVIMVDPLEAKRLASKQMEEIKGRERQQRRRDVEAINGAWAIIGLLIGLVIEAQTGKGILAQLDGYWSAVLHLFTSSAQI